MSVTKITKIKEVGDSRAETLIVEGDFPAVGIYLCKNEDIDSLIEKIVKSDRLGMMLRKGNELERIQAAEEVEVVYSA